MNNGTTFLSDAFLKACKLLSDQKLYLEYQTHPLISLLTTFSIIFIQVYLLKERDVLSFDVHFSISCLLILR